MQPKITSNLDATLVANYFLAKDSTRLDPDITQMKLHKLMYFAQAHFLAQTGLKLFNSTITAYKHGPIVEKIYQQYREYGRATIIVADEQKAIEASNNIQNLPIDVLEFLNHVWSAYGDMSASQLRKLTHSHAPWKTIYKPGELKLLIPDTVIAEYYRENSVTLPFIPHPNATYVPNDVWEQLEKLSAEIV